jgi:hypothetical protein
LMLVLIKALVSGKIGKDNFRLPLGKTIIGSYG